MDFAVFKKSFYNLGDVPSITGRAGYHSIRVSGDELSLTRNNTGSNETISLKELYDVYQRLRYINTSVLRDYITGRVYSPAFAVLVAAGLYDVSGKRVDY